MAKEKAKAQSQAASQMTEEQRKEDEKVEQENVKIRGLNELLNAARAAMEAKNFDQAIALMTQATTMDPTKDLLWFHLGEAYLGAQQYDQAIEAYQKAVAIKPAGSYYNNLGQALVKSGRTTEAASAYTLAAAADPAAAGQYYFNLGAILTNKGQLDQAIAAFDKAIAADPVRAEAYYWKGINLIGKAETKDNKMVAPPGTDEAFNKYL
ncbi:MAG: tetratricopeptide repeat protein, partial [Terriglobales bacterium]